MSNPVAVLDAYTVRHLIFHLLETNDWERLHALLNLETLDGGNLWFNLSESHGLRQQYLQDIHRAWSIAHLPVASSDTHILLRRIRYALVASSLQSMTSALPVEVVFAMMRNGVFTVNDVVVRMQAESSALRQARIAARIASLVTTSGLLVQPSVQRRIVDLVREAPLAAEENDPDRFRAVIESPPRRSPRAIGFVAMASVGWMEREASLSEAQRCVARLSLDDQASAWADITKDAAHSESHWLIEQYLRVHTSSPAAVRGAAVILHTGCSSALDELWERAVRYLTLPAWQRRDDPIILPVLRWGVSHIVRNHSSIDQRLKNLTSLASDYPIAELLPLLNELTSSETLNVLQRVNTLNPRIRKLVRLYLLERATPGAVDIGDLALKQGAHRRECELVLLQCLNDTRWSADWCDSYCSEVATASSRADRLSALSRLISYAPLAYRKPIFVRLRLEIQGLRSARARIQGLISLIPFARDEDRSDLIDEIVTGTRTLPDKEDAVDLLAQARAWVASSEPTLLRTAIEITLSITKHENRARAWERIGSFLQGEQVAKAIESLARTQDERERFSHLLRLALVLPERDGRHLISELIETTLSATEPIRTWKLARIAGLLNVDACRRIADVRFRLVDEGPQARLLAMLMKHGGPNCGSHLLQSRNISDADRAHAVVTLSNVEVVERDVLVHAANAVRSIRERLSALASLDAVDLLRLTQKPWARVDSYRAIITSLPVKALARDAADLFEAFLDELDGLRPQKKYADYAERAYHEENVSLKLNYLDLLNMLARRLTESNIMLSIRRTSPVNRWIGWIAPQLSPVDTERLFSAAKQIWDGEQRADLQVSLLGALARKGYKERALELLREVDNEVWPISLAALGGYLSPSQLDEILMETDFKLREPPFQACPDWEELGAPDDEAEKSVSQFWSTEKTGSFGRQEERKTKGNTDVLAALMVSLAQRKGASTALGYLGHLPGERQVKTLTEIMTWLTNEQIFGAMRYSRTLASSDHPFLVISAVDVLAERGSYDVAFKFACSLPMLVSGALPSRRSSFLEDGPIVAQVEGPQYEILLDGEIRHTPRLGALLRLLRWTSDIRIVQEMLTLTRSLPSRLRFPVLRQVAEAVASAAMIAEDVRKDLWDAMDREIRSLADSGRRTLLMGLEALVPLLKALDSSALGAVAKGVERAGVWWP